MLLFCQGGFHVACMRALPSLRRPPLPAGHLAALDWPMINMGRSSGTWWCGACIQEGRWGISHLIESAVTFGDTCCAKGPATYSVHVHFHADGAAPGYPPEPRYLHGRPLSGCVSTSEIQDPVLYQDSNAACAGGRTRMASSATCCSALCSPGRHGSVWT